MAKFVSLTPRGPDPQRVEANRFYNSARWRALRAQVLNEFPLCQDCESVEATIGHHVIERSVRPDLELVRSNIRSLCDSCHNATHKGRKPWQ